MECHTTKYILHWSACSLSQTVAIAWSYLRSYLRNTFVTPSPYSHTNYHNYAMKSNSSEYESNRIHMHFCPKRVQDRNHDQASHNWRRFSMYDRQMRGSAHVHLCPEHMRDRKSRGIQPSITSSQNTDQASRDLRRCLMYD